MLLPGKFWQQNRNKRCFLGGQQASGINPGWFWVMKLRQGNIYFETETPPNLVLCPLTSSLMGCSLARDREGGSQREGGKVREKRVDLISCVAEFGSGHERV